MVHSDLTTIHLVKDNKSQLSIKGVITVQIQCAQWTSPSDVWQHRGHPLKIK